MTIMIMIQESKKCQSDCITDFDDPIDASDGKDDVDDDSGDGNDRR